MDHSYFGEIIFQQNHRNNEFHNEGKESLAATNAVCTMPVFRPVIGFDKQEIVDLSEKIGTYETSIQPFEDCCTIFVAKHPVTRPNIKGIAGSERRLSEKIDELVKTALDTDEVIRCQG